MSQKEKPGTGYNLDSMSSKESKSRKKSEVEADKVLVRLDDWLNLKMAQDKKLRSTQRRELEVFLRKQGLSDFEESERYEKAYNKF